MQCIYGQTSGVPLVLTKLGTLVYAFNTEHSRTWKTLDAKTSRLILLATENE
jgi:hypothetical protein